MTYLVASELPAAPAGERFRALPARPGILGIPDQTRRNARQHRCEM